MDGLGQGLLTPFDTQATTKVKKDIVQINHGFITGQPVYYDPSSAQWILAIANDSSKLATHIIGEITSSNSFEVIFMGVLLNDSLSFTTGWQFVSTIASGTLTNTEPSGNGDFSNPVGFAPTVNELWIFPYRALQVYN